MKLFSLSIAFCWGSELTVTSTPATEFRPTSNPSGGAPPMHPTIYGVLQRNSLSLPLSPSDEITQLLMLPHSDGCVVHLCYNSKNLPLPSPLLLLPLSFLLLLPPSPSSAPLPSPLPPLFPFSLSLPLPSPLPPHSLSLFLTPSLFPPLRKTTLPVVSERCDEVRLLPVYEGVLSLLPSPPHYPHHLHPLPWIT